MNLKVERRDEMKRSMNLKLPFRDYPELQNFMLGLRLHTVDLWYLRGVLGAVMRSSVANFFRCSIGAVRCEV